MALVPTAGIMAQPVIGLSNMPQVGDSVIIALSNQPVAPGTAGADQTWDMTWISAAEEQYFVYEDPAVTPWADLFDDATICGRSGKTTTATTILTPQVWLLLDMPEL